MRLSQKEITMYEKKTSAQLKQIARGLMLGKYRNAIGILLASECITSTISLFTATSSTSLFGIISGIILNLILILFASILQTGQYSFYLNIACGQSYGFSDLFTGFKVGADKIMITALMTWLIVLFPILPAILLFLLAANGNSMVSFYLAGCILLILGTILSCFFALRFSQAYYLLLDFPDYSSLELLKMSWKLMKGNCGRLFYLSVSFLPLTLVSLFTLGIGLLFITPYQSMSYALFYLDLIQSREA